MEIREDDKSNISISVDESLPNNSGLEGDKTSILRSTLFLDNVGEVVVTLNYDGLSWKSIDSLSNDKSTCLGIKLYPKVVTELKFSDVYGVEFNNYSLIHGSNCLSIGKCFLCLDSYDSEMFCFRVHVVKKSQSNPCLWIPDIFTFGHKDLEICHLWADRISASLNTDMKRPKNLLVFINPMSGKANGRRTWENVAPIFSCAEVKTKVIVTQRAGQAFDIMGSIPDKELNLYDGVIIVGGDGFFNEVLNGFLLSRHKAPQPLSPSDFVHSNGKNSNVPIHDSNETNAETSDQNEDHCPLLSGSTHTGPGLTNFRTEDCSGNTGEDVEIPLNRFRFGIIPSGSTDAIVMCTTGARDPMTSALHIVLGKKLSLDIAQVVRWKATSKSDTEPFVRYAASFAGYGFYGDVITESEKYRWMGPKRYDYAGTKVFLRHRSYEAEIAYIETESEKTDLTVEKGRLHSWVRALRGPDKPDRVICRMNCSVCSKNNEKLVHLPMRNPQKAPYSRPEGVRWLKSKGRFLSVGAAMMSNRNEKAPDGLVADAHLSDGFLHLLLVRDCPRALYLWHLTQLAKRGGRPLDFDFVEHHKTTAFTFTSFGTESVWNLDGELFPAHQLSAQVFQGLVNLFASGPEV